MRLHTVVGSPNGRKVMAVINHLAAPVEVEYHDFFTGELRQDPYRALNRNAMVPVLEDGDFSLWESNAINQYLADKLGADALFPRDPRRRADVVRWQCWELAHFNRALGLMGFETVLKPMFKLGEPNAALVEAGRGFLQRFAPVLDTHVAERAYLVGDGITIADYSMIHLEGFKDAVPFDWSPYPHLNAYFDRMRQVEPWARTAPPSLEAIGRRPMAA